jgi:hypothetical protein
MKITQLSIGLFARGLTSTVLFSALLSLGGTESLAAGVLPTGYPAGNQNQSNASVEGAAALPSPSELLVRVRVSAEHVYRTLTNFVCNEQIERYRGSAHNPSVRKVDVITSEVSYSSNAEHYADIYQNNKPLGQIGALSGAWSEGEYGTVLRETVKALESRTVKFVSFSILEGKTAAVYSFDYTAGDSPWDIAVAGVHYTLPFHGQVWASPVTGDILRIDRIAHDVPMGTGISGVNWAVMFGPMQAEGKNFWLPVKGVYSVSYLNSDRHEWNQIAFSGYKHYGSDVVLHFR